MKTKPRRFRQIYLEITTKCNLRCSFCPGTSRAESFITTEIFTDRVRQCAPLCDKIYFHLMGEPLIHPQIYAFMDIAHSFGLAVGITTNGTLVHKHEKLFLHPNLTQLNISLHAAQSSNALDTLLLYCISLAQKRHDLCITIRLWNNTDIENPMINTVIQKIEQLLPQISLTQPQAGVRGQQHIIEQLFLHCDTPFDWPGNAPIHHTGTCHGLHHHMGILVDGTVVPCCLDRNGDIPLGNCNTESLEKILRKERTRKIRQGFSTGIMHEDLCQKCGYAHNRFAHKKFLPTMP